MEAVDLYTRLSILDASKDSLERQKEDLHAWAASQGLSIRKVWTDSVSGYKTGAKRDGFLGAVEAVTKGEVSTLAVWKLDRLSRRGSGQVGLLLDDVEAVGGRLYFLKDNLDSTIPGHRMVIVMLSEQARSESANTSLRVSSKNASAVSKGLPTAGKRRFGYLSGNIAAHPEEGPQVQALFADFLAGASVAGLAKRMGWRNLRVRETLSNPSYAGWVVRRGQKYPAADHVERLVSQEDFDAVQARLQDRSETYRANSPGGIVKHLASGIARCGVCDTPMVYRNAYLCLKDLSHPTIKEEFVDRKIQEAVVEALIDPDFSVGADSEAQSIREAQQEIASLEEGIQDLLSGLNSNLKMAQLLPHLKPLQEAQAAAQSRIEALLHESVQARLMGEIAASIKRHLGSYPSGQWPTPMPQGTIVRWEYRKLSLDQKRELVRGLLDVKVNPGRGPGRVIVTRRHH